MHPWHVITYNSYYYQSVIDLLHGLGVEAYAPCRLTMRPRTDRPSPVKIERPLFPGYLFVRFDEYQIHFSTITALSSVNGFVRFDSWPCLVSDSVVEELKASLLLLQTDPAVRFIEHSGVPSELAEALNLIIDMRSEPARRAALLALLKHQAMKDRMASSRHILVATVLDD